MKSFIKKTSCILCCALIGVSIISGNNIVIANNELQEINEYEIALEESTWLEAYEGGWNFPISSDDEEWQKLSIREKRAICNMPTELLQSLSTEEVIQLALQYPLLVELGIYNSYEMGLEALKKNSNIINEVYERTNIGEYLLNIYEQTYLNDDMLIENQWLETSLLDESVKLSLSNEENNKFSVLLEEKRNEINDEVPRLETTNNSVITLDSINGFVQNDNATPVVDMFTQAKYIWGKYYCYGTVAECKMWVDIDYNANDISSIRSQMSSAYPTWVEQAPPTKKYNCHSYCWISASTSNKYWLDDPTAYMNANSYIGQNCEIISSNYYVEIFDNNGILQHSARVITVYNTAEKDDSIEYYMGVTKVESKMGTYGVYQQMLDEVFETYNGSYYRVYRVV